MLRLFKHKVEIPDPEKSDSVWSVKSWTLTWYTQGDLYDLDKGKRNDIVFTNKVEADKFSKALKDAANLLKVWVNIEIKENA